GGREGGRRDGVRRPVARREPPQRRQPQQGGGRAGPQGGGGQAGLPGAEEGLAEGDPHRRRRARRGRRGQGGVREGQGRPPKGDQAQRRLRRRPLREPVEGQEQRLGVGQEGHPVR